MNSNPSLNDDINPIQTDSMQSGDNLVGFDTRKSSLIAMNDWNHEELDIQIPFDLS